MKFDEKTSDLASFKSFAGVLSDDDDWDEIEKILEKVRQIPRTISYKLKKEEA